MDEFIGYQQHLGELLPGTEDVRRFGSAAAFFRRAGKIALRRPRGASAGNPGRPDGHDERVPVESVVTAAVDAVDHEVDDVAFLDRHFAEPGVDLAVVRGPLPEAFAAVAVDGRADAVADFIAVRQFAADVDGAADRADPAAHLAAIDPAGVTSRGAQLQPAEAVFLVGKFRPALHPAVAEIGKGLEPVEIVGHLPVIVSGVSELPGRGGFFARRGAGGGGESGGAAVLDEGPGGGALLRGGRAAKHLAVDFSDAGVDLFRRHCRLVALFRAAQAESLDQAARHFHGKPGVHHEQALGGHGGAVAPGGGFVGQGKVEGLHLRGHLVAVERGVNGAAVGVELPVGAVFVARPAGADRGGDQGGRSAARGVEFAGHRQHGVAHRFVFEPAAVEAPQQAVVRVAGDLLWRRTAGLLVGGRSHDEAVQPLDRPAVLDEIAGQPVEQVGVGRRLGAQAEVAGGLDQSAAEVVGPDPVDDDPRGERIVGGDDGLGQLQPAGAVGEGPGFAAAEQLDEAAVHGVAPAVFVAADVDVGVVEFLLVAHHHGAPRRTGVHRQAQGAVGLFADQSEEDVAVEQFEIAGGHDPGGVGAVEQPAQRFAVRVAGESGGRMPGIGAEGFGPLFVDAGENGLVTLGRLLQRRGRRLGAEGGRHNRVESPARQGWIGCRQGWIGQCADQVGGGGGERFFLPMAGRRGCAKGRTPGRRGVFSNSRASGK